MKILHIGDVNGKAGRQAVKDHLPTLVKQHSPELIIANVDNISHGSGANAKHIKEISELGVDILMGGDHILDRQDCLDALETFPNILRPANISPKLPGRGLTYFTTKTGKKIICIHILGQVFMSGNYNSPFDAVDDILQHNVMGKDADAIFVDFHAEATSEKMAMGRHLDGRVSAVIGTHTHVPTADAMILPKGTGYMTDVGMTGCVDGVIGADETVPMSIFLKGFKPGPFEPASGPATIMGIVVDVDENTGKTLSMQPFQKGGYWDDVTQNIISR